MSREIKIIITGVMGSGKTTAIASVSEVPTVTTEAHNSDLAQHSKLSTTVALDYGEVQLEGGDRLRLYGTPGQGRFNFMWQILAKGALGVVILVDMTRPDPLADLRQYAGDFADLIRQSSGVVGMSRASENDRISAKELAEATAPLGLALPIFTVDVRQRADVLMLLEALFSQIEMSEIASQSDTEIVGE
jgi:uncharacterized protein